MTISPAWRLTLSGLRSWLVTPPTGTGGTVSARYCYSVFMRHRIIAARHGLTKTPYRVVELGPGDSLGIGLTAMLTGSERYIAVDAVRHASSHANIAVFDELVAMLKARTPIPFDGDCVDICPALENYDFPHHIFDDATLDAALAPSRLAQLRNTLGSEQPHGAIEYLAPMGEMTAISSDSVDWIFSQAVMEHVANPLGTYLECTRCLDAGGIMTHQIDFRCHDTATEWNGHWKYPRWLWSLMRGRRPWFVNRLPYSAHLAMLKQAGFKIVGTITQTGSDGIARSQLAADFRSLSDTDLQTCGVLIAAMRGQAT